MPKRSHALDQTYCFTVPAERLDREEIITRIERLERETNNSDVGKEGEDNGGGYVYFVYTRNPELLERRLEGITNNYSRVEKLKRASDIREMVQGENNGALSINSKVKQAFDAIIKELRENWRVSHPTIFEKVIGVFREHLDEDVSIEELLPLFQGSPCPRDAAINKITKLNDKLEPYGLRIVRVKGYRIVLLGEES